MAMEVIVELMAKAMPLMPDMKIEGDMSEDLEAKLWEKRMPDLTPAEQLAVEIDRFIYNYDTNVYHDNNQTMTENVSEFSEMIKGIAFAISSTITSIACGFPFISGI